ncbi:MAG TPA: hypothetical protein VGE06_07965 [Flavisolibacter sp.]
MSNKSETALNSRSLLENIISSFFGVLFLTIGLINTFWGNDTGYGIFIVLLSAVFFQPVSRWIKKITGYSVPFIVKFILALFILWSALGVAELFDKIELMRNDL